jgi:hypothetical protein
MPLAKDKNLVSDPFFTQRPSILWERNRLVEFVPRPDMTKDEKLNAVGRGFIYLGSLLAIIYRNLNAIYITLIGLAVLWLVHDHYPDPLKQQGGNTSPDTRPLDSPSPDNPFMNVLLSDYVGNPYKKPAADLDQPETQAAINKQFNAGLYRDVDDLWDKANSQRQYYAAPSTTIPNDQDSFARWCYNTPYTCKDGNQARCLRYEDLRGHGQPSWL